VEQVIEVQNLVKRYRKATEPAVDGISFDVAAGEFFAFLGPNGAGKTTTISILTTTLSKTSGAIRVCGHDVDTEAKAVRRDIGIIFQNPSLDLTLSGEENVRLHAGLYGLYGYRPAFRLMPAAYRDRIEQLAAVVGLEADLFKRLKTYSGGMRRKLEIVRSLLHHPKVLFLDEPTQGLDAVSRRTLWEHLNEVRAQEGITIFLTTHDLDEAEPADRVCILNHGRIALLGTPDEITRQLVDRYVLVDADDRPALRAELDALRLPVTSNGTGFKVPYDHTTPQALIARIRTPLTRLQIHEPTVEDAYVDLLDRREEAAA